MFETKFNGYRNGARRYFLDMGDSEAPDYTPIANANAAAAAGAKEIADKDIAFREKVYGENKPYIEAAQKAGLEASTAQLGMMRKADARSDQQWDQYTNTFVPIEQQMAKEAMDYGSEADQETQAGRAVADVRTQGGIARENTARSLAAMGVNPNSGRFASGMRRTDIEEAGAAGSVANNARLMVKDKGIGLRAGAAAFGRNQVNAAGQMAGVSSGAGSAGVGSAGAGANAALPMAQFAAGGTGNAINAANVGISGNNALIGAMGSDYRAELGQSGGAIAGLAGLGQGLGAMGLKFSDRRMKENIVHVGETAQSLGLYEFNYIGEPARFRGVMADEVALVMPEAVVYDDMGFASVNYPMLGIQMEEV
jgi:hypothetical protein